MDAVRILKYLEEKLFTLNLLREERKIDFHSLIYDIISKESSVFDYAKLNRYV